MASMMWDGCFSVALLPLGCASQCLETSDTTKNIPPISVPSRSCKRFHARPDFKLTRVSISTSSVSALTYNFGLQKHSQGPCLPLTIKDDLDIKVKA